MAGAGEIEQVKQAIISLDGAHVGELVREAVVAGASTKDIVENGMRAGMTEVGRLYEQGEYYLAEFIASADVMEKGLAVLKLVVPWEAGNGWKVVLASVEGDLHDMGKNLVAALLSSAGFKVFDAGVDEPAEALVETVRANSADAVGLSVVLASRQDEVGRVVKALEDAGLRDKVKVMIGGFSASDEVSERYGCDRYVRSAFDAPSVLRELLVKI